MSIKWMVWAWEQDIPAGEKLTLMALADHAGEDGHCWPSTGRLAEKTGQGKSTVRRHIESMERRSLLCREIRRRDDGSQTSNIIHLLGAQNEHPPAHSERGASQNEKGASHDGRPPAPNMSALEPSFRTVNEPSVNLSPIDEFDEFWTFWPKKIDRAAAVKAFRAARKKASVDEILDGLHPWMRYWDERADPSFIPYPATWLNKERWKEAPALGDGSKRRVSPGMQAMINVKQREAIQRGHQ